MDFGVALTQKKISQLRNQPSSKGKADGQWHEQGRTTTRWPFCQSGSAIPDTSSVAEARLGLPSPMPQCRDTFEIVPCGVLTHSLTRLPDGHFLDRNVNAM